MSRTPLHLRHRPAAFAPFAIALAVALTQGDASRLSAQEPPPTDSLPEPLARPVGHPVDVAGIMAKPHTLIPVGGPPGTPVALEMSDLPALTALWLGIGAPRQGFEALSLVITDAKGELKHAVAVPTWAGRDRSHRFVIFDAYFRPISMTRPFHVTDHGGTLWRRGQVVERVDGCARLVDEDEVTYALWGEDLPLVAGEEVIVVAKLHDANECGEVTTLEVEQVYPRRQPD